MTREEAIDLLDNLIGMVEDNHNSDYDKALKVAIMSLKQETKTGHLIRWYETIEHDNCIEHNPHCKCSECDQEYDPYNASLFNYCPNCGAKVEE